VIVTEDALAIEGLVVGPTGGGRPVVDGVSLRLRPGEVLALIGESGSGKSTISLACLGHIRPGLVALAGSVRLGETEMLGADPALLARLRGRQVAYVAQSAAASFNPALRLNPQVIEPSRIHGTRPAPDALRRAVSLYRQLGLPYPDTIGERYPHQVSGGQLQRFMVAMGMMEEPLLLVLDEPTSALDVTTQVEVLDAMRVAVRGRRTAALFVSHDLPVVAQMADRILVLRHGRMVEEGTTEQILEAPQQDYTKALLAAFRPLHAVRRPEPTAVTEIAAPALEVSGVTAGYGRAPDGGPLVKAVQEVGFRLGRGRILAVVGESGSGKSSLAQVLAGLLPPAAGEVRLSGEALASAVAQRSREQLRRLQILFQMADTALNPQHTIGRILGRVLTHFWDMPRARREQRTAELLEMVRLPASYAARKPSQLSGGEKQRVNLARALAAEPEVLICDEITSALDTVVGAAIVELIEDLRSRLGLSVIFISHDLPKVAAVADDVLVMRHGRVVEAGPTGAVFGAPEHPYTRLLLDSVPELRRDWLDGAAERRQRHASVLEADA
jgi:peptide/nickel transport system ATP-binding protein